MNYVSKTATTPKISITKSGKAKIRCNTFTNVFQGNVSLTSLTIYRNNVAVSNNSTITVNEGDTIYATGIFKNGNCGSASHIHSAWVVLTVVYG